VFLVVLEQTAGAATRKIRNGKFRGGTTAAADVSLQACNWIPFQPLAQIMGTPSEQAFPAGTNRADADNKQFALNVMHWLSRILN